MKGLIKSSLSVIGFIIIWNLFAYRDVDEVNEKSDAFIKSIGMEKIAYHGYQGSLSGGGTCWYHAKDAKGIVYQFGLSEWRGDIHLYSLEALNQIQIVE